MTSQRLRPAAALPPLAGPGCSRAAAQAYVLAVVARSGTSFYWSMRLLPRPQREAMFAVYAFCREVDDVADGAGPAADKLCELAAWRAEIAALYRGRPSWPTTLALAEPVARFELPRAEFEAMIEGMEMDAREAMRAPEQALLARYCRCVAGAVGLLSMSIFGRRTPELDAGSLALGDALQLTNILRDLAEDAARERLYLPRELLDAHGITARRPQAVLQDPRLPAACAALAAEAAARFAEAEAILWPDGRHRFRPALVMMQVYRRLLERLVQRGWRQPAAPVRLGGLEKLWLGLRYGLL